MNVLVAIVIALTAAAPADPLAEVIVKHGCYANHSPPRAMVDQLLSIEAAAGITGPARGILVAAACNESGFNPDAMGDWKDILTGKRCPNNTAGCVPKSFGLVQFQGWAKRRIARFVTANVRDPRMDWRASATYWARHLVAQVGRVQSECRYPDALNTWRAAHRTAITTPKCGRYRYRNGRQVCAKFIPRCHRVGRRYRSKHWEILTMWKHLADRDYPRPVVVL